MLRLWLDSAITHLRWYVLHGTWYGVCGTGYVVQGKGYMVRGTWYMVQGTGYGGYIVCGNFCRQPLFAEKIFAKKFKTSYSLPLCDYWNQNTVLTF